VYYVKSADNGATWQSVDSGDTPIDDYRRRIKATNRVGRHGMWINRYAYLTDEKLAIIGQVTGSTRN
jgi:hypothetical protein